VPGCQSGKDIGPVDGIEGARSVVGETSCTYSLRALSLMPCMLASIRHNTHHCSYSSAGTRALTCTPPWSMPISATMMVTSVTVATSTFAPFASAHICLPPCAFQSPFSEQPHRPCFASQPPQWELRRSVLQLETSFQPHPVRAVLRVLSPIILLVFPLQQDFRVLSLTLGAPFPHLMVPPCQISASFALAA
jgi:hypothetical protein